MSSYQALTVPARDGYKLSLRIYEAEDPKAVVKCIHGMEEYQDRYREFAEFLQGKGYTVITANLRGHGPDAPFLSHIADEEGDALLLEDEETILSEILKRWPGLPLILFGHSMGTIIARAFLRSRSREYTKAVLSGYPNPNPAAGAGLMLARMLSSLRGGKGYSKLVDNMVLGTFSKAVPDAKSPLDWLSVNRENVENYAEDPLCGARFTLGSYQALFGLIRLMNNPKGYHDVHADLPILLISGAEDPCTGGEKGRKASEEALRKAGFRNLETETLEGMRHEILNEKDRQAVYEKILAFLEKE